MLNRSAVFICFLFATLFSQHLFAAGGRFQGFVIDGTTDEPLPGANIVFKGTGLGGATDIDGAYIITNIPPGFYTVSVIYIGYESVSFTLEVAEGQSIDRNIPMNAVTLEGEEIVVTAQAEGQNAAINKQLSAENIVNVVSSARIQELPDANAAESIGRLPGISLVRSGGQATQVVIRGLRPEYNSITIDGVQIPANDGGTITASGAYAEPTNTPGGRAVDMSMISSNSLESIEVFKTVSPDMDAAVLGGTVNFGLREAKGTSSEKPLFSFLAQGAYNDLISTYDDYKFVASAEQRFFDEQLGVYFQGIAQKQNLTSNQLGGSYYIPNKQFPDSTLLSSMNLSFNPTEQKRYDVNLTLDYRIPDGKIALINLFSHGNTRRESHSETYNLEGNSIQFGTQLTTNENNVVTNILKYEQTFGSLNADVKLSNAYSDNRTPDGWSVVFSQISTGISALNRNLSPAKIANQAKDKINLDNMYWQGNSSWDSYNKQDDIQGSFDLEQRFTLTDLVSMSVKGGGQYKYSTRYYDFNNGYGSLYSGAAAGFRYDLVHALPWLTEAPYNLDPNGAQYFKISGFYDSGMDFGNFLDGKYDIHSAVKTGVISSIMDTIRALGAAITTPQTVPSFVPNIYGSTSSDYHGNEFRSAEYLMATINIGPQITVIPGIRYQGLKTTYTAAHFIGNADAPNPYPNDLKHTIVTKDQYHGFWLPNVRLRYNPLSWLSLRSAYTTSLAYPGYSQIIPRLGVASNSGGWVVWNNYALKPAYAQNFDFQVAVYDNNIGLFALSPFLKRIDNLIFQQSSFISDPSKYEGIPDNTQTFALTTYINNPHRVDIWGIESEWQTHFWYLPGIMSGLVMNINYTHIFSKAKYPYTKTVLGTDYPFLPTHVDTVYTDRLIQQPNDIVNLSVGWDYKKFSILASLIYQAEIYNTTAFYNSLRADKRKYLRWDFSVKQGLPWYNVELYFDLNNLNSEQDTYLERGPGFPNSISSYGLTADFGLRVRL